jgi:hypothetical protein
MAKDRALMRPVFCPYTRQASVSVAGWVGDRYRYHNRNRNRYRTTVRTRVVDSDTDSDTDSDSFFEPMTGRGWRRWNFSCFRVSKL